MTRMPLRFRLLPLLWALIVTACAGPSAPVGPPTAAPPFGVPTAVGGLTPGAVVATASIAAGNLSADELAYTRLVAAKMGVVSKSLDLLAQLMTLAGQDTTMIRKMEWRDAAIVGLATLRDTAQELNQLQAPERFGATQSVIRRSATHLLRMTQLLAEGVDAIDAGKLDESMAEMNAGSRELLNLSRVMELDTHRAQRATIAAPTPAATRTPRLTRPALLNLTPAGSLPTPTPRPTLPPGNTPISGNN